MASPAKKALRDSSKIGYLQKVPPLKTSENNNKYFNAVIQTADDFEDVVSFRADAYTTFVDMSRAKTPVCLQNVETIPSRARKGLFDVKFSSGSKIVSPQETITFPFSPLAVDQTMERTIEKIKEDGKAHDKVTLTCKVKSVEKPQMVKHLRKATAYVADVTGYIEVAFWNEQIETIQEGDSYKITDMTIRLFQGVSSLTTTLSTTISKVQDIADTVALPAITEEWQDIETIELSQTNNCKYCKIAITCNTSNMTIKCTNCGKKMFVKSLEETVTLQVTVNGTDFYLPLDLLQSVIPDWKAMNASDVEDELLINFTVLVKRNNIVAVKKSN